MSQSIQIWKSKTQIQHSAHFSTLSVVLNHKVAKNNPQGLLVKT